MLRRVLDDAWGLLTLISFLGVIYLIVELMS